jgi:hypothetical protein
MQRRRQIFTQAFLALRRGNTNEAISAWLVSVFSLDGNKIVIPLTLVFISPHTARILLASNINHLFTFDPTCLSNTCLIYFLSHLRAKYYYSDCISRIILSVPKLSKLVLQLPMLRILWLSTYILMIAFDDKVVLTHVDHM